MQSTLSLGKSCNLLQKYFLGLFWLKQNFIVWLLLLIQETIKVQTLRLNL